MDTEKTNKRISYIASYAYDNVPFYREWFDKHNIDPENIQTAEDLIQLPTIGTENVLENQPPKTDEFRFLAHDNYQQPFHTTGTKSQSKTIFVTRKEWEKATDQTSQLLSSMAPDSKSAAHYVPFANFNIAGRTFEEAVKKSNKRLYPLSDTPYPAQIEAQLLQQYKPDIISGMGSHIDKVSKRLVDVGVEPSSLDIDIIIQGGEGISEGRRSRIEDRYDAPLRHIYPATEGLGSLLGAECLENKNVYHLSDDIYHIEILDEQDNPVEPGEEGRVVITRAAEVGSEPAMPLIRYELGDYVTYADETGGCGCDYGGGVDIRGPIKQESTKFSVGGLAVSKDSIGDVVFKTLPFRETAQHFQVVIGYEDDTGRDIMEIRVFVGDEGNTSEYIRNADAEITTPDPGSRLASNVIRDIPQLGNVIENSNAVRLDINVVDETYTAKKKPVYVVDERE